MEVIKLIINLHHFPIPIGYCINWIHDPGRIKTYALQCPICKKAFSLANHTIVNGVVNPSVVCPFNCGYHVMMRID